MITLKKPKTLKERLQQKGITKLVLPKVSTALANLIQLGPRVVMRSVIHLVKVNPLTRLISVLSLVAVDLFLYIKKRISGTQLVINLIFSCSMLAGSTIGWYAGENIAKQLAFDFLLGLVICFITMFIGIHIFNVITERVITKWLTSDVDKGLEMVNEYCSSLGMDVNEQITKAEALLVFRSDLYREKVIKDILWPREKCIKIRFVFKEVVDGCVVYKYYPNDLEVFGEIIYKREDRSIQIKEKAASDAAGCFIEQNMSKIRGWLEKVDLIKEFII